MLLTGIAASITLAGAAADMPDGMRPYTETVDIGDGQSIEIRFLPVPGGTFLMGSPEKEKGRASDEGPQVPIEVEPFWIMACEVTWEQYKPFMRHYEIAPKGEQITPPAGADVLGVDAVSYPTPLFDPSYTFNSGDDPKQPACSMSQFAARHFTKWLSMKTGRFYRLPTEAEWEYACRAGTTTAYFFGDAPDALEDHAWYLENSYQKDLDEEASRAVGQKKPNAWGLHDMHGNVAELTLDRKTPDYSTRLSPSGRPVKGAEAVAWPTDEYPRVYRGGSFLDDATGCRAAARRGTTDHLKHHDPQFPKSIWWYTDARHIGFRVVRPGRPPTDPVLTKRWWEPDVAEEHAVLEKQRTEGR